MTAVIQLMQSFFINSEGMLPVQTFCKGHLDERYFSENVATSASSSGVIALHADRSTYIFGPKLMAHYCQLLDLLLTKFPGIFPFSGNTTSWPEKDTFGFFYKIVEIPLYESVGAISMVRRRTLTNLK